MSATREIWVLPELTGTDEEIGKTSLGLLSEARYIADRTNGTVTALVLGDSHGDYADILGQYGVSRACVFRDPLLRYFSAEAYAAALLPLLHEERPWLFLMGHTTIGREFAPRLAGILDTGLITNCAVTDLSQPEHPLFFRPVYADQLHQEVVFQAAGTMLVTMDTRILNINPVDKNTNVDIRIIEPGVASESFGAGHIDFLPADFQTVDVAEADTIVSAGMGAVDDDLLPLVEELAGLIEGSIGTTRPVIDSGKLPRERMIGQTGKVVSPDFYLALGISGASHHVGGIQDSGRIIAVNRDPQADIFRSADAGVAADLRDVLPKLIERIKQAKSNGEIL